MSFFKINIIQQSEGKPGFAANEEVEIQIDSSKITLFNRSEDDDGITFVRMTCGATLCVATSYDKFVKSLQAALQSDPNKVTK